MRGRASRMSPWRHLRRRAPGPCRSTEGDGPREDEGRRLLAAPSPEDPCPPNTVLFGAGTRSSPLHPFRGGCKVVLVALCVSWDNANLPPVSCTMRALSIGDVLTLLLSSSRTSLSHLLNTPFHKSSFTPSNSFSQKPPFISQL